MTPENKRAREAYRTVARCEVCRWPLSAQNCLHCRIVSWLSSFFNLTSMNNLTTHAAELFPNHPAYQTAWLRMIKLLGPKWLLATPVRRTA